MCASQQFQKLYNLHHVFKIDSLQPLDLFTSITMADGQLFKPEKDYTKETDKQIPEAQEIAKVTKASATP